ncbi:SET domain-containing protein [Pseudomonas sp. P7]|uniref:dermonecrotic toxin domain-containing protein n=1 Tax=Pseudomonas TaxID=286 RepID=UPI000BC96458|nr:MULTISPECIES: DUF6543 domain-containing protein [Pseudomonas]MBA2925527.1 SET domain-containing protein [Pseudomonas sivasensis]MCT4499222.1 hypothetical protein [Pseudomonas sivasensis]OYT77724.1 MAG: hypothetical protein CFE48_19070 [Pseudomonas sp. PGPPP2]
MGDSSTDNDGSGTTASDGSGVSNDYINIVASAVPSFLLNAPAQTLKTFGGMTPQLPEWWTSSSPAERATAASYAALSIEAHSAYVRIMADVQAINDFAAPLLTQEIKKIFGLDLDVNQVWLELYTHASFFSNPKIECFTLLQAALHNFEASEGRAGAFYISEFFNYGKKVGIRQKIQGLTIEKFVALCRDLDLGAKYQQHIKDALGWSDPEKLEAEKDAFIRYQKASLKTASYIALLKTDIQAKHYQALLALIDQQQEVAVDGHPLWLRGLNFMGMNLNGCVVFEIVEKSQSLPVKVIWPFLDSESESGFIVYIPDDPDHPVKHYSSLAQLKAQMKTQFLRKAPAAKPSTAAPSDYQLFFSRFVAFEDRPAFFNYFTERVPGQSPRHAPVLRQKEQLDFLLQFRPMGTSLDIWEEGLDLWACLYRQWRQRGLADARRQAVPTEDADAKSRREWIAQLLEDLMAVIGVAAFAVPALGVVLLGATAVKLMNEVLEGIEDLSVGDKVMGWAHIVGVVNALVEVTVTGLALSYVVPEEMNMFRRVTSPDGRIRLQKVAIPASSEEGHITYTSSEPTPDLPAQVEPALEAPIPVDEPAEVTPLGYREYAVDQSTISTLTPSAQGIYRTADGQQFYIRDVRGDGREQVYQIRDNFRIEADIFDVNVVDAQTNRQTGYWLRRVGPDQWESIGLKGGVEPHRLITGDDVRDWSELSEVDRSANLMRKFARQRGLFYPTLRRYVLADGSTTPEGVAFLDNEHAVRTSVTAEHLSAWERLSPRERHELTREGFANQYLIEPDALMLHIAQDGSINDIGRVLLKHAGGGAYTSITREHLSEWKTLYETPGSQLMARDFATRHNLNPIMWGDYVKQDGSFTKQGMTELIFERANYDPLTEAHLDKWYRLQSKEGQTVSSSEFVQRNNIDPLEWARHVRANGKFTLIGKNRLIFGEPGQLPANPLNPESLETRIFTARKSSRVPVKRPAQGPLSPQIKVPRREPTVANESKDATLLLEHEINNDLPILQDPSDVTRSLTAELEGEVDQIEVTYWNSLLDEFGTQERLRWSEKITQDVRNWIRDEGRHAARFLGKLLARKMTDGPDRGLSVVALRRIRRFEVLGPYSGKLHQGDPTLMKEIAAKGRRPVETYSFQSFSNDGTLSAHGSGNILSLINSPAAPGQVPVGEQNVGSIYVGRYMTFFVAWRDIEEGEELLLDYGPFYKWD